MTRIEYGPAGDHEELEALARLEAQAFAVPAAAWRELMARTPDEVRVARVGGRVVGGLLLVPMGQYFGGRSVPSMGVAGVGVAPTARGRGVATALMHAAVREMRARGFALSSLYPATLPLYRRAGYELAGGRYRFRMPCRALPTSDRDPPIEELGARDHRRVASIYRTASRERDGYLDRGEYVWHRVRRDADDRATVGHGVRRDGRLEGYAYVRGRPVEGRIGYDVIVTDMAATGAGAARRILGFLGDHRSLARDVVWAGGVDDPFLALMPEKGWTATLDETWMLRVVDIQAALEGRGFPPSLRTRLELSVRDPLIRANRGRWVIEIAGGRAEVRPGGRGSLALSERALASMYSGWAAPAALAARGELEGPKAQVARATEAFPPGRPAMADFF